VIGAVGTGRRTLAGAIASLRSQGGRPVAEASAFEGVPDDLHDRTSPTVLLLHHLQALDDRGQTELAGLVRDRRIVLVATGKNRERPLVADLAALVDATTVTLPLLSEREGDALQWADFFAGRVRAALVLGVGAPILSPDAKTAISTHAWPGNLSELESVVRRAVLLGHGEVVTGADLGFSQEKLKVQGLEAAVEEFRMTYVLKVLAHFGRNRTQTAKALGVDPRTVFRYLERVKEDPAKGS
jgi:DNA-binding NtrC family response regulator